MEEEARYLYRAFFRGDLPAEVVEGYVAANRACGFGQSALVEAMAAHGLDAEAIELVLRRRGRSGVLTNSGVLTKKIQILFYLLEARAEYEWFFRGQDETRLTALAALADAAARTLVKYVKGEYLVRRYRLV
jgi:hypothetical protein